LGRFLRIHASVATSFSLADVGSPAPTVARALSSPAGIQFITNTFWFVVARWFRSVCICGARSNIVTSQDTDAHRRGKAAAPATVYTDGIVAAAAFAFRTIFAESFVAAGAGGDALVLFADTVARATPRFGDARYRRRNQVGADYRVEF
jgi:hypothetical protein